MSDLVGHTLLNRYRVERFIGRGAMAEVYKVWDVRRTTYLAMKLLHDELAMDSIFLRRFQREARMLAQLQHPNIVRFYGLEEDDPRVFILMDYVEGSTLQREIHQAGAPLPIARIMDIMRPVCGAIHFAHLQNSIHCDLKPSNILTHRNGAILVTDFGLAHLVEGATSISVISGGTPAYMSPEQVRGEELTPQTDVYSLGVVLYEMLTGGERPFSGESSHMARTLRGTVLWEQLNLTAPSPRRFNPDISSDVEAVVLKCLQKKAADRYASAFDLLMALEVACEIPLADAAPTRSGSVALTASALAVSNGPVDAAVARPRSRPRGRRKPIGLLVGAASALILGAGGLFVVLNSNTPMETSAPNEIIGLPPTATSTNTLPAPTDTATATSTSTATSTATATSTPTLTPTSTQTATATMTHTPTRRPTRRPTATPTITLTVPPTDTETPLPPPTDKPEKPPKGTPTKVIGG